MSGDAVASSPEVDLDGSGVPQRIAFDVLSARRRRYALHYLLSAGEPVDLRTLSEQVAAWENDVEPASVSYKQRMRAYTALRQTHLPKLDDAGIVEFDPDRGLVSVTDSAAELSVYLEAVPHRSLPWSTYYLAIGGLALAAVLANLAGVPPLSVAPPWAIALAVVFAYSGAAAIHRYRERTLRAGEPPE